MFKFKPILKSLVWGGEQIIPFKGLKSTRRQVGESWELSGLAGHESIVASGPDRGLTLRELIHREGEQLVGKANYKRFGEDFPLLIKFIDASQDLSVQVHPNDRLARRRHGCSGKSEMWYIVRAEENARLRVGFKEEITADEYEKAVEEDRIVELLQEYTIQSGDLFYLPAGRIHTICAGAFLVEIQQSSDITYRIYDYNRPGADGQPRELHTDLARKAIDYSVQEDYRSHYTPQLNTPVELIRNEHFTAALFDINEELVFDTTELDSFVIVVCTAGSGSLTDENGVSFSIHQGETILIPATTAHLKITPKSERLTLLSSWVE